MQVPSITSSKAKCSDGLSKIVLKSVPQKKLSDFFEEGSSIYEFPVDYIVFDFDNHPHKEYLREHCREIWKCITARTDLKPIYGVVDIKGTKECSIVEPTEEISKWPWIEKYNEFKKLGLKKAALVAVKTCQFCDHEYKIKSEEYTSNVKNNNICTEFTEWDRQRRRETEAKAQKDAENPDTKVIPWQAYKKNKKDPQK